MMQGFLKFMTSSSIEAKELLKRVAFKVVPMSNVDGVIAGNYRTSLAGNDLNRRYQNPHPQLHPVVTAMKKLVQEHSKGKELLAFVDLHGHSRKKNAFVYGNYYPIHSENYLRLRMLPKLLGD